MDAKEKIKEGVQLYFDSMYESDPGKVRQAFHPNAMITGYLETGLAEIEKTKSALREAYFKMKKEEVKLKKLERKLLEEDDHLEREMLEIKINEKQANAENSRGYVEAAVRKLNFFTNQYDNLMKKIGKEELTEADYELEEVKYHIMTCMKQALNSARPRGGVIDEGNMIYLFAVSYTHLTLPTSDLV